MLKRSLRVTGDSRAERGARRLRASARLALLVVVAAVVMAPVAAQDDLPLEALLAYFAARAHLPDDDALGRRRGLEQLMAREKSPLARAQASWDLARELARAGELERARKLDEGAGFVSRALLLGPLEKEGALAGQAPLPVEQPFSPSGLALGVGREVGFQRVESRAHLGGFDVDSYLEPDEEVGALLVVGVRARRELQAAVRVGSSAPVVVRWNGLEVARDLATRSLRPDQTSGAVVVRAGVNLLVVRTWTHGESLDVTVRLTTRDGAPLGGVEVVTDEKELLRAVTIKERARAPAIVDAVAAARSRAGGEVSLVELRAAIELEGALSFADERAPEPLRQVWLRRAIALAEQQPADGALALDHLALAEALVERDPSAARAHLARALALDDDNARAHAALARLYESVGLFEEARASYGRARTLAPGDATIERARLAFERLHGHLLPEVARAAMALAERHPCSADLEAAAEAARDLGDSTRALALLARVATSEPASSAYVHARLEAIEHALVEPGAERVALFEELFALLSRRLAFQPAAHGVARQLALALYHEGRRDDAVALARARTEEFPGRTEPLRLLADLALMDGQRDEAKAALARSLAIRPQHRQVAELVRALSDDGEGLAARYGVDPRALPPALPDGALDAGAHVVAHTIAARFFENGLGEVLTDRVIAVHDAQKAGGLRELSVPYSEGRELVEVLRAERHLADGRVEQAREIVDEAPDGKQGGVYTDVHYKVVSFGEVAAGDRIHLRVVKHLVGQQNLFGDFFGLLEAIESPVPTERWRLVVEAPRTRPLSVGGRGAPLAVVREPEERPDVRIYELASDDVKRLEVEPGMPPFYDVARYVSVSTYPSWAAMGRWYADLVDEQLRLDAELERLAKSLVEGAGTLEEKVRRVYEHVVTSTRYVGIELGIHGWKPYPVAEVYRRRYGDCKDKASLLVALLGAVGVEARLTLVRTAPNGVLEDEPASMWAFNHAIAYVPALDLFLDGTAERSGMRELPDMDQGAMALIVEPKGSARDSRLVVIPVASADENLNLSRYELSLGANGSLSVAGSERFRGAHNAEQRRQLFDDATRREGLERQLSAIMPGTRVTRVDVTDLSLSAAELGYDFVATIPTRALSTADGGFVMPLSLYPHALVDGYAERSRRAQAVWLAHPWRTRNVMRYRVPPGFEVVDLPSSREVKSEHLVFTQTITRTDDGFIVDEDTAITSRVIPPEGYAAFRKAALEADAMMKRKVRLARSKR